MTDAALTECARCGAVTQRAPVPGEDDGWLRFAVQEVRVVWLGSVCPQCQAEDPRTEDEWMMYIAVAADPDADEQAHREARALSQARELSISRREQRPAG